MSTTAMAPVFGQILQSLGNESSDLIGQVIAAARTHLGAEVCFLAEFQGDRKLIRRASGGGPALQEGSSFPLQETYCYRLVRGDLSNIVADARNDDRVKDLAITAQLNIGCYVGVPISVPGGRLFGTLCCVSSQADPSLHGRDVKFMRVLADLIGGQIAREEQAREDRQRKADRIVEAIEHNRLRVVFQPIVDLATGGIVGAESLARFDAEPQRSPDRWFAEAWEAELGVELEIAAVRAAVAQLPQLPPNAYMSVNVSPRTIELGSCDDIFASLPADRIVVEVTEHAAVGDYDPLMAAVAKLKRQGFRVAVDDVGVGYSGLSHILRLAPAIMKLDLTLTRGIHTDPAKQAMASATVNFALRTRVSVVAEGIESKEDAETLRVIGVQYGQGYYFGKPSPLPLRLA